VICVLWDLEREWVCQVQGGDLDRNAELSCAVAPHFLDDWHREMAPRTKPDEGPKKGARSMGQHSHTEYRQRMGRHQMWKGYWVSSDHPGAEHYYSSGEQHGYLRIEHQSVSGQEWLQSE